MLERDPELVDLHLNVLVRDPDRAAALAALTERAAALQTLVAGLGAGIERYANTGFNVYPQFSGKRGDQLRGYEGRASLSVTLADFELLPRLITGANEVELSEVGQLVWRMRRDSLVFREARLAAVEDALSRARDYAAAFGSTVTGLIEVTDVGLSGGGERSATRALGFGTGAFARGGGGGEPSFDLAPQRQEITGQVEARFSMTDPELADDRDRGGRP
ncbi:MAG: hypothetical protein JWO63_3237 [Frankiales bacterium]|nr:hypothetical protein [Frankiales bacterium]